MSVTYLRVRSDGTLKTVQIPWSMDGYTYGSNSNVQLSIQFYGVDTTYAYVYDHSKKLVTFLSAIPAGVTVQISRQTSAELRYRFTRGARFNASNLEYDLLQVLRVAEEARSLASAGLLGDLVLQGGRLRGLQRPLATDEPVTYGMWQELQAQLDSLAGVGVLEKIQALEKNLEAARGVADYASRISTSNGIRITDLTTRVEALENAPPPTGGNGANLLDASGKLANQYWPSSVFGYFTTSAGSGAPSTRWYWREQNDQGHYTLSLLRTPGTGHDSIGTIGILDRYQFRHNVETIPLGSEHGYDVVRFAELRKSISKALEPVTQGHRDLSDRVGALELGGGGGGPGSSPGFQITPQGEVDLQAYPVRVASPTDSYHAVTLNTLNTAVAHSGDTLRSYVDVLIRGLSNEVKDRLDAQGSSTPGTPAPTPPTGSTGGSISCGMTVSGGVVKTYAQGVLKPSTGTSSAGNSVTFTFPKRGLWEVRIQTVGGKVAVESFFGVGEVNTASFGEYVILTAVGYSGVTVTIPSGMRPTQKYSMSAIFIGEQV